MDPLESRIHKGFIILDKWKGPTSHDVSAVVRQMLGAKKVAHLGTLDPQVSGVLPLLVGEAVKLQPLLQRMDKEYVGVMQLHSDTLDKPLRQAIEKYTGTISQRPPVRSAVSRRVRQRAVHKFDIIERKDRLVLFRVFCEAGTYIRSLCHQVGSELGGAQMVDLRRTKAGPFAEAETVSINRLSDEIMLFRSGKSSDILSLLRPAEDALRSVARVWVKPSSMKAVMNGSPLRASELLKKESGSGNSFPLGNSPHAVAVMSGSDVIAVGSVERDRVRIDRVLR